MTDQKPTPVPATAFPPAAGTGPTADRCDFDTNAEPPYGSLVFELDVPMVMWTRSGARPLTHNDRHHPLKRARLVKTIRDGTHWAAKNAKLPKGVAHATVQLHYRPGSRSVTDAPNLTATSKPAIDGLVDYGLVPDDTDRWVTEVMPTIHPGPGPRRCWLTVEVQR